MVLKLLFLLSHAVYFGRQVATFEETPSFHLLNVEAVFFPNPEADPASCTIDSMSLSWG
jgi:hypothetical protein